MQRVARHIAGALSSLFKSTIAFTACPRSPTGPCVGVALKEHCIGGCRLVAKVADADLFQVGVHMLPPCTRAGVLLVGRPGR
jgi:hypothetical protein